MTRLQSLLRTATIVLVTTLQVQGQDYLWPTNASRLLSASFGEYRRSHLHTGIDIKTNQRTGYAVFAVADGYIAKVSTNFFGYGKWIYQRLDDGNYALYAHLQGFSPELQQLIAAEQERQQRYAVTVMPEPQSVRVTKGTIIGYTGVSGTLAPHLHFEIRDSTEAILNPLTKYYRIQDNIAPFFTGLTVTPVDVDGRIEGQPHMRTYVVHQLRRGQYLVKDTIRISGKVGLEVSTYDQADGAVNRFPPYGIQLFISDSLVYQIRYERFTHREATLARIDRNYQLDLELGQVFNRLWSANEIIDLPMKVGAGHGVLDLVPGYYHARIEAYDANSNRTTLRAVLHSCPVRELRVLERYPVPGGIKIQIAKDDFHLSRWRLNWCTFYGQETGPVRRWTIQEGENCYLIEVNERSERGEVLKIEALGTDDCYWYPLWIDPNPVFDTTPVFQTRFVHNPKTFFINFTFRRPPPPDLQFFLQTGSQFIALPAIYQSPTEVQLAPLPRSLWQKALNLELRLASRPMTLARLRLNLRGVVPQGASAVVSDDSLFQVTFPAQVVYDTLLVWWGEQESIAPKGAVRESENYTLLPANQPLAGRVDLAYKIGCSPEKAVQLGLCVWQDKKWQWLETEYCPESGLLTAQSRRLWTFAVWRDTVPPQIAKVYPGNGGRFYASDVRSLRAKVWDDFSGIPDDRAIRVFLDGQPLIVEYDAAHISIFYSLRNRLQRGLHTLRIEVRDRAENVSIFQSNFTILPG